jgi:signal transduction histidine kinase
LTSVYNFQEPIPDAIVEKTMGSPEPDSGSNPLPGAPVDPQGPRGAAAFLDAVPFLLLGVDAAGAVTHWNRQAERETGIPAGLAAGRSLEELLPAFHPCLRALCAEVAQTRRPSAVETLSLEGGGANRIFEILAYPVGGDGAAGTGLRLEDVTERSHMHQLMIQAEKLASISGLAAGIAHEINNPLGIISQAAQNVERRLSPGLGANRQAALEAGLDLEGLQRYCADRKIQPFLESIQEAVARATSIVGKLVQLSRRPEEGPAPASLPALLQQALDLAASDFDLRKQCALDLIEIRRDVEPDLPAIPLVASEIEQVLLNLLKNAVQALAANPPERPRKLDIRIRREGAYVALEMADSGPGMAEAVLRRIFEPFFTTKAPGIGTGLGLAVSYMIVVHRHRGRLDVASEPGRGATFTLRLPLRGSAEAPEGSRHA